jgi:phage tail protein X
MREYLGLEGGPPTFRQDFTCPALLEDGSRHYPYGAVTRYGRSFQIVPVVLEAATGLVRVRSPLLAESLLMSFPPGTEMFQFPGLASNPLCIQGSDTSYQMAEFRRRASDRSDF